MDLETLENDVWRAYERGRIRLAFVWGIAALAAPMVALGLAHDATVTLPIGLALAALSGWGAYRGLAAFAGLRSGLLAGAIPFLFSVVTRKLGLCCVAAGQCVSWCAVACGLGGLLAAATVVVLSRRWYGSARYWGMASIVTLLLGSLGYVCAAADVMTLLGLGAGFLSGLTLMQPALLRQ